MVKKMKIFSFIMNKIPITRSMRIIISRIIPLSSSRPMSRIIILCRITTSRITINRIICPMRRVTIKIILYNPMSRIVFRRRHRRIMLIMLLRLTMIKVITLIMLLFLTMIKVITLIMLLFLTMIKVITLIMLLLLTMHNMKNTHNNNINI